MSLRPYNREPGQDYGAQDAIADYTKQLTTQPGLSNNRIESVSLSTSVAHVAHKLGRRWRGWRVTDQNADATIYRDPTSTADQTKFISLLASASVTVDLEVF